MNFTSSIGLIFLSWAVVGGFCWLGGYWHGRTEAWSEARKHFVDVRYRLFTGRAL